MLELDAALIAIASAVFLLAGLVKGVIGLGLPTVSVAGLSLILGLPTALPLMVVPSVATNVWQALSGKALATLMRRFWSLLAASVVGVLAAYELLFVNNAMAMTLLLGLLLCVYSASGFVPRLRLPRPRRERFASPIVGLSTGVLAGATGSMVMPVVAYLQALRLSRHEFVQMMGMSFTVSSAAIGLAAAEHGDYDRSLLAASVSSVVPALLGMWIGQELRARVSETVFRRGVYIGLFAVGLNLVWKGLG